MLLISNSIRFKNYIKRWLICTITTAVVAGNINCQTFYFDSYGAIEGASSKIYCIVQDDKQNIWMGTPAGVSLFDGNEFKNFTSENGLAPQAVRAIFQDNNNNIWIGHAGGGITLYKNNLFTPFNKLKSKIQGNITSIFQDYKNNIWFTTESSGVFVMHNPLSSDSLKFKQYIGKNNLSDRVYNYCITKDNSIYLVTDVGIRKFNEQTETFEVFNPKGLTSYFSIIPMFEDDEQNLWFGTYNGGLYKYFPGSDTVIVYDVRDGISSNWISSITQDRKGNIWIGTWGGGVTRINDSGISVFNNTNGLEAENIFSIIEDFEGNILIGSQKKGLSIFKGEVFVNYGVKDGLQNTEVNSILTDKHNNYWIGTNGGVFIFDSDFKTVKKYNEESFRRGQTESFISNKIRYLLKDNNQNIWVGTQNQRVLFYNSETGIFRTALDINKWFTGSDFQVTAMAIDKNNRLWTGTYDGLICYNIETGKSTRLSNENGLVGNNITAIYCDKNNQTWVGSYVQDGISKIVDGEEITTFKTGISTTPSCMVMDKDGVLWIGTQSQGILLFKNDFVIGRLNQSNGLISNRINTLNLDDNNNIYIGTSKGLNIYNRKNNNINTYGAKNGFIGVETNPMASYYSPDKKLWFGTNKGVNMFDPIALENTLPEPLVYISSMKVNQKETELSDNLQLKHKENQISFSYKSICLTNSEAVCYKIMLEGIDQEWQEITTQTSITYQTLPPDKYCFKVIARNSSGEWNKVPVSYSFQILPPIYLRWYFILATIIFVLAIFIIYIKIRERNLIREKRALEEKVRQRTVELSNSNAQLAMKNKDITDSIKYAQRIQMAILPKQVSFSEVFILFKPKDIVSGDFYWMAKKDNKELIAAVDCTGHGVPGAFISFVGYSSLNKVVKEKGITKPSEVLDKLNESVEIALNLKENESIQDGMDLALICYDKDSNTLEYAGAYNPLYLIRNKELKEIKADRFPIGKSTKAIKKFTNHSIKIEKGDSVYIFSDGYIDQFGGEENKKFKAKKLKELLLSIQEKPMDEQKEILNTSIEEWRGDNEQIDDILLIGRRFD